jgi:hypothetical protein
MRQNMKWDLFYDYYEMCDADFFLFAWIFFVWMFHRGGADGEGTCQSVARG